MKHSKGKRQLIPQYLIDDVLTACPVKGIELALDAYGHLHAKKAKPISHKTRKERRRFLRWFARFLERDLKVGALKNLSQDHIRKAMESLRGEAVDWATLHVYLSHIRVLAEAIRKPGMVRRLPNYFPEVDPRELARGSVCLEDKSWHGAGKTPEEIIASIAALDDRLADLLRIAYVLGLRLKEASFCEPARHLSTVDATATAWVEFGAKGGLQRIPTGLKGAIAVVELLQARYPAGVRVGARSAEESPKYVRGRLYRAMRKCGFGRKESGVVPHGGRHEYVHDRKVELTGVPVAVRGGDPRTLLREVENEAVSQICRDTGHARRSTPGMYGDLLSRSPYLQQVLDGADAGSHGMNASSAKKSEG